jgi:hypothetical protein
MYAYETVISPFPNVSAWLAWYGRRVNVCYDRIGLLGEQTRCLDDMRESCI